MFPDSMPHVIVFTDEALQQKFSGDGEDRVHGLGERGNPQQQPALAELQAQIPHTQGDRRPTVRLSSGNYPSIPWTKRNSVKHIKVSNYFINTINASPYSKGLVVHFLSS